MLLNPPLNGPATDFHVPGYLVKATEDSSEGDPRHFRGLGVVDDKQLLYLIDESDRVGLYAL
jgi:hypothetical protein